MQNKYQYCKALIPCFLMLVLASDAMARRFPGRPAVRDAEINRGQAEANRASQEVTTKFANKGINYLVGQSSTARTQAIKWLSEAPNDPIVHKLMEIFRQNSRTSQELQLSEAQIAKLVGMVISASRLILFDPLTAIRYILEEYGIKPEELASCRI